jgi:hypothetical protein
MCVRLQRALQAGEVDMAAWQAEIAQVFEGEISIHFLAEEREVFPIAAKYPELQILVEELKGEHEVLRILFSGAQSRALNRCQLGGLQAKLSAHIRKEERQLFQALQERLTADEMTAMGAALDQALAEASKTCTIPKAL